MLFVLCLVCETGVNQIVCVIHQIAQNQSATARKLNDHISFQNNQISSNSLFRLKIRRTSCEAIGDFANEEGADVYCQYTCIKRNADCPADRCKCY